MINPGYFILLSAENTLNAAIKQRSTLLLKSNSSRDQGRKSASLLQLQTGAVWLILIVMVIVSDVPSWLVHLSAVVTLRYFPLYPWLWYVIYHSFSLQIKASVPNTCTNQRSRPRFVGLHQSLTYGLAIHLPASLYDIVIAAASITFVLPAITINDRRKLRWSLAWQQSTDWGTISPFAAYRRSPHFRSQYGNDQREFRCLTRWFRWENGTQFT